MTHFEYIPRKVEDIERLAEAGTIDNVLIYFKEQFLCEGLSPDLTKEYDLPTAIVGWKEFEDSPLFLTQNIYKKGDLESRWGTYASVLIIRVFEHG